MQTIKNEIFSYTLYEILKFTFGTYFFKKIKTRNRILLCKSNNQIIRDLYWLMLRSYRQLKHKV